MMRDAGHFDQIKRLRIAENDLVPFTAAYDVRDLQSDVLRTVKILMFALDCTFPAQGILSTTVVDVRSEGTSRLATRRLLISERTCHLSKMTPRRPDLLSPRMWLRDIPNYDLICKRPSPYVALPDRLGENLSSFDVSASQPGSSSGTLPEVKDFADGPPPKLSTRAARFFR